MSTFATLEASALAEEVRVIGFRGTERLCRPYELEIFVQLEGHASSGDLGEVIASKATLKLQRDEDQPQRFHGILGNVSLLQQTASWSLYRLLLVPRLWQLGLTRHSRVFTKQSVPSIIETVLTDAGFGGADFELRLDADYASEELVVQYGESKLAFLQRWMEREGLYYFFEQGESAEKLVVVDHGSFHQPMVDKRVRYFPLAGHDTSADECFDTFAAIRSATVSKVRLADYDYARPMLDVSAEEPVSPHGFGERHLHAARFFDPEQAKRYARIRSEELKAQELVYHAAGTALHMSAGFLVELVDHATDAFNAKYLLTEVHHFCNQLQQGGESHLARIVKPELDELYRVEVKAADASQPYRAPEATPRPRVWGYEGAVVDGPAESEYAQLDDQGRYHVKFAFDESELKNGKASTPIRMMQPHGGTTEGWHFPLRKGTEVIVAFLGGDPDRPVIAGVVPNQTTPSPVTEENQTLNVIQTGSGNRFELQDVTHNPGMSLRTPNSHNIIDVHESPRTGPDGAYMFIYTSGNQDVRVGCNRRVNVGGNQTAEVIGDVAETYSSNHATDVAANFDHTIGGSQTVVVSGARDDTVNGGVTASYGGHLDTTVSGPESRVVTGPQNVVVAGSQAVTTGARLDTINGSLVQTVSGPVTIDCPSMTVSAPGGIKQNVCSWLSVNSGSKISLTDGTTIDSFKGSKVGIHQGVGISVFAGLKFSAEYSLAVTHTAAFRADFGGAINLRTFPTVVDTTPVWVRQGAQNILFGMSQFLGGPYVFL